MDARQIQEQASLFSNVTRTAREIEVLRHAAMRARDEALAEAVRGFFARIGQGFASVGAALRSWPDRSQTYENLRSLSDRELADIGLTRAEINRVFEPDFHASTTKAQAANGNRAPARASAAA